MSESARQSPRRKALIATLVGLPLALLLGAGILHAQHFLHHDHSPPAGQLVNSGHLHAMLGKVGASAEQQARIDGILAAASREMEAVHAGLGDAHRQLAEVLLAPAVDQGEIETLRAGQIAVIDSASRHLVAAMQEAVLVLSPEQRALLLDLHHPHGG